VNIDRRLNLVQTFETNAGTVHVHSTPISHEVWRDYFLILSKTYSQIFAQGLGIAAGPQTAGMLLEKLARADNVWDGPNGVESGLMAEIRRLTNVIIPGPKGWDTIPYETALQRGIFDGESIDGIEGAIVFFICASALLRGSRERQRLTILLSGLELQLAARSTSLDCMAWAASLPTSMPAENIGEMVPVSSLPH
jgi:hypothetical protein